MKRGGGRPKPTVEAKLQALYASVPDAGCRGLCEHSCSSISMTPLEQRRILARTGRHLPRHGAFQTMNNPDGRCPALVNGQCSIYDDRPFVCHAWGSVESMPCPHGCEPAGGRLPAAEETRLKTELMRLSGVDRNAEQAKVAAAVRTFFA